MAEFPNLGKHCDYENCSTLDFLPFLCDFCKKTFCLKHRQGSEHDCKHNNDSSCGFTKKSSLSYETPNCSYRDCNNRELVEIRCDHCKENFCLQHRHQQDHSCVALNDANVKEESKTAALVRRILDSKESSDKRKRSSQGKKSDKTSSMLNLMKIKMKAQGDSGLPQEERIYISVDVHDGTNEATVTTKAFYFSKLWTVGKVVDHLASVEKLKNENNLANGKKLLLFKSDSSDPLTMNSTLDNLITTCVLYNGDTVSLRYERSVAHEPLMDGWVRLQIVAAGGWAVLENVLLWRDTVPLHTSGFSTTF